MPPTNPVNKLGSRISVLNRNWKMTSRNSVLVVVDEHLVKHAGIERKIVGSVGRLKQRVNVQNEGDFVRDCHS